MQPVAAGPKIRHGSCGIRRPGQRTPSVILGAVRISQNRSRTSGGTMPQRLLVAAAVAATLFASAHASPKPLPPESTQAAQDLAMEQAEEHELRAWFDTAVLALRADGTPTVL